MLSNEDLTAIRHLALGFLSLLVLGCDPAFEAEWEEEGVAVEGLSRCAGGVYGAQDYCTVACPGNAGDGDCDSDAECASPNICGLNNGARYGFPYNYDFCAPPHCFNGTVDGDETAVDCGGPSCGACVCSTGVNGDAEFCTLSCPCGEGEGDCDVDGDCDPGLRCVSGVGVIYGQSSNDIAVCVASTCFDGMQNGTETGVDCGGGCYPCSSTVAEFVSVNSAEVQANGRSELFFGASSDGRYVAFGSAATNLVANDTNGVTDIFLRDRISGTTIRVSVGAGGAQANAASNYASVSDNGRIVAFVSAATNLVSGDTNGVDDVFVRDVVGGTTTRVSLGPSGAQLNAAAAFARIESGGRYIAYSSSASNIVAGDTNGVSDVFVADRVTLVNTRVSVGPGGVEANGASERPSISTTGRWVAFQSTASNLIAVDANGTYDIFVRDRTLSTTTLVSATSAGAVGNSASLFGVISGSGGHVAFRSLASDLVAGDTNARYDIFVRARTGGTVERVSVATGGAQANNASSELWISSDGTRVVFATIATNLGGAAGVYARDRTAGTTSTVFASGTTVHPFITGDGHSVLYRTDSTSAVTPDTNGQLDIVVQPL